MRFKFNKIELEGLVLRPSTSFSANLTGMFDLEKDIEMSETTDSGVYLGLARNQYKKLTLNVMVKDRYDFKSLLALNGLLAKEKLNLTVDLEGLGELTTEVICQSKATADDVGKAMSIEFIMPNPYFKYLTEVAVIGINEEDNSEYGLRLPTFIPFSFIRNEAMGIATINNYGNTRSWGEITIEGKISQPKIVNRTTNEVMYFDTLELQENDILRVSCDPRNRYITLNGKPLASNVKKGEWISFEAGANHIIFSSEGIIADKPSFTCKVKCVSRVI